MNRFKRFLMFCIVPVAGLLAIDLLSGGRFLDPLFFLGLLLLMVGGSFHVIQTGVFDGFIRSFMVFKRSSAKLENYVSSESSEQSQTVMPPLPAFVYLAWTGALLIAGTGLSGAYIY